MPTVPARRMLVQPEHMRHACEYCLVVAAEGEKLQMCGRCKAARYCNAECQHADWARHKKPDCIGFSHDRGRDTPLQRACMDGNLVNVLRLVEEEGADVDKATSNGPTPLGTAAARGHFAVVRYLVERGADVDKARATSYTPLYGAAAFLPIVRYLVEHGADKDKADGDGWTPLLAAATKDFVAAVRYLVEQGADKNKTTFTGETPLYLAAASGNLAIVQCLVQQGADKSRANNSGWTALRAARSNGHAEVVAWKLPGPDESGPVGFSRRDSLSPL